MLLAFNALPSFNLMSWRCTWILSYHICILGLKSLSGHRIFRRSFSRVLWFPSFVYTALWSWPSTSWVMGSHSTLSSCQLHSVFRWYNGFRIAPSLSCCIWQLTIFVMKLVASLQADRSWTWILQKVSMSKYRWWMTCDLLDSPQM